MRYVLAAVGIILIFTLMYFIYTLGNDEMRCGIDMALGRNSEACLNLNPRKDTCRNISVERGNGRGYEFIKTTTGQCYCIFSTDDKDYDGVVMLRDVNEIW